MFSEIVDEVVRVSGRVDKKTQIISYVNATVREIQTLRNFSKDLIEDILTAGTAPYTWTLPEDFRRMITAQYSDGNWPEHRQPGRMQALKNKYYYYQGPDYLVFNGLTAGMTVNVAYIRHLPSLEYYEAEVRPAVFDRVLLTWEYLTAVTDEEKEIARMYVSNWILKDWKEAVVQGTLAKIQKDVADARATVAYSLYRGLQVKITETEHFVQVNT